MADPNSTPAPPAHPARWPSINPAWVGLLVMAVVNVGAIGVKFSAIEDHGLRIKALEVKDASRDVQQAEFRSDLTYIKERLSEIRAAVTAAPQPAQVVYPQYPPGYQQPGRRAAPPSQ